MNLGLQLSDKHPAGTGNGQPLPPRGANVPVRLQGWSDDGAARVELLSPLAGMALGTVVDASLRPMGDGRRPQDFNALRKAGLRIGGIVLLRKALVSESAPDAVTAREIETLVQRRDDGVTYVLHGAAASICPPPPGTLIVSHCFISYPSAAVEFRAMDAALSAVAPILAEASQFGPCGLVLTGEDVDGEVIEVTIGGTEPLAPEEVARSFRITCPPARVAEAAASAKPWRLVPFFRCAVDIGRAGKLSAQRANLEYGEGDEIGWTACDAVLRTVFGGWAVCDVSSAAEPPPPASLLLDLAEAS